MDTKQYIIVDIETTWLSKTDDRIIEIAAVRFDGENILDEYQTLVNPQRPISSFIKSFTGIDNSMVEDAPRIQDVLPWFFAFLQEDIFVAHNASFDYGFISTHAQHHLGHKRTNEVLCTRKLANRMLPHLHSKSLGNLCNHYNIINAQAHRAMADVLATKQVLKELLLMAQTHHTGCTCTDMLTIQSKSVGFSKKIFPSQ